MRGLPTAVRMHILTELACFATPTQVVESVKAVFAIEVSRQCVEAHHPERRAGAKLNPALCVLFYEARAKLLAELDDIGLASRAGRLRALDRMAGKAERMGNLALAVQLIQQAAREVGGMYEKRQRLERVDSIAD
ncbi:DUF2280 domain-containing protein [Rugamonas sp.]|uniref:DUF2280 domain-containing protein n=1 Tax=Rugamonas sp. TaxID=1926287 RepID=UPI0025D00536|nr:DUF2280 domain-containing protein [Rugamonas sp.]